MITLLCKPNSSKPVNPYAPPFLTKSAAVVPTPMLPHELCNQQFQVPAATQPGGMPLGFPCLPGQNLLWHTSVTYSLPFQRRDVYCVYSQPFWPNNDTRAGVYSSVEEPLLQEKAGSSGTSLVHMENKLSGARAKRFVSRGKYVNGRRVVQQKMWSAKKSVPLPSSSTVPEPEREEMFNGKTSVMIKNVPNQFERHALLNILDEHCLEENTRNSSVSDDASFTRSEYDFAYLPMDFRSGANKGYAFVNFTSPVGASRFAKAFEKHQWRVSVNKKICEITVAKIQGKDCLQNHFKNSAFPCRKNSYLPVVFSPPRDGFIRTPLTLVGRRA